MKAAGDRGTSHLDRDNGKNYMNFYSETMQAERECGGILNCLKKNPTNLEFYLHEIILQELRNYKDFLRQPKIEDICHSRDSDSFSLW